jgi:hypothetical protein
MSSSDPFLVHNVYFSLTDHSPAARRKLIEECRTYLPGHPGIVFFGCGEPCAELAREVNDRDWDVGLHIIFKDRSAHDHYQQTEAHLTFIDRNKATWTKVRVFDSLAGQSPTP